MIKVLFVCLGNICRSPMAEAVFAQLVRDAGLQDQIEIDSAGTGSWHAGQSAHRGTLDVLRRNSIPYNGRARQIRAADMEDFNYIITMDNSNLEDVRSLAEQHAHVLPLLSFASNADRTEVPDPYYDGGFDGVYDLVRAGCEGLLEQIRATHNL